jgi:hypothetical protein
MSKAASTLGTMCPLTCFGHWIGAVGVSSKYSRSSSSRVIPWVTLSTTIRTVEALDMDGLERPSTRWTKDDLPTPVAPITAMLKDSMSRS